MQLDKFIKGSPNNITLRHFLQSTSELNNIEMYISCYDINLKNMQAIQIPIC